MGNLTPPDLYLGVVVSTKHLHRIQSWLHTAVLEQRTTLVVTATIALVSSVLFLLHRRLSYDDELPIVNRWFVLEPRIFARWRWAFRSDKILDEAYAKVGERIKAQLDIFAKDH